MPPPSMPFPLAWSAPLPAEGNAGFPPVLAGGAVIWRSGDVIGAFDAGSGAPRWIRSLPAGAGEGEVLVRGGGLTITDRRRDRLTSLVAFDDAGAIAWDVATELVVTRGGVFADERGVMVAGIAMPRGAWALALAASGAPISRRPLPLGGTSVMPVPAGLLVCNPAADHGRAGLYLLGDGDIVRELARGSSWRVVRSSDAVVTLNDGAPAELVVRDLVTLEPRWRAPASDPGADADRDTVACVERDGGAAMLALRDLATGELRWRVAVDADEAVHDVTLAGPLVAATSRGRCDYFRRADGSWLGSTEEYVSPPVADDRHVYIGETSCLMAAAIS